jgi:transposase InsO family protein
LKYAFMRQHVCDWPVRVMGRVLKASVSGYYAWLDRAPSVRSQRRSRLLAAIRTAHAESRQLYGSPRVHAAVVAGGEPCCVKTVARLMRAHLLRARTKRKYKATTNSSHDLPVAPNRLGRDFHRTRANQAWVADITYIWTNEGWLYLAVELDLYSRRIVGWSMSERMSAELVLDALDMAIRDRRPSAGLIHHSDRGSQYASQAFQAMLAAHGMVPSMSRRADCYDNAVMESFFGTLKKEWVSFARYATRAEARVAIFDYIEVYYNRRRLHSTLGNLSPSEYESRAA